MEKPHIPVIGPESPGSGSHKSEVKIARSDGCEQDICSVSWHCYWFLCSVDSSENEFDYYCTQFFDRKNCVH